MLVPGPSRANGLAEERAEPHREGLTERSLEHFQRGLVVGEEKFTFSHFPVEIKFFS